MKINKKLLVSTIYLVVLLAIFTIFIYTAFFTDPMFDDYANATMAANNSLLEYWLMQYLSGGGRYFCILLVYFNPIVYGSFVGCQYVLAVLIASSPFAYYFFINSLFKDQLSFIEKILGATGLCLLGYYLMPTIPEAIYWFVGAVNYQLPVLLSIIFLGLLHRLIHENNIFSYKIDFTLLVVLQFCIIGSNEINMIYLDLFLLLILLYFIIKRQSIPLYLKELFILAIIFSAFALLAPGNGARANLYPERYQLGHSLYNSILQVARFSIAWVGTPLLLISTLVVIYLDIDRNFVFSKRIKIHPFLTIISLLLIVFLSAFLPYWATGTQGQHRTVNVASQFFILCWFVNLGAIINKYPEMFSTVQNKIKWIGKSYPFLFIIALLFSGNTQVLISDHIAGRVEKQHRLLTERQNTLSNLPAKTNEIYLPILKEEDIPRSIFIYEIKEDPCNDINNAYSLYFNLERCAVKVKKN